MMPDYDPTLYIVQIQDNITGIWKGVGRIDRKSRSLPFKCWFGLTTRVFAWEKRDKWRKRAHLYARSLWKNFSSIRMIDSYPEFGYNVWWMNVYVPNGWGKEDTDFEIYRTWSSALSNTFKFIGSGSYILETGQSALRVSLNKNSSVEEAVKELEMWLPHYRKTEDDSQHIGILEHTLSEYGVYFIKIFSDKLRLMKTTYGTTRELESFDDLKSILNYVREHHYYKKDENDY